VDFLRRRYCIKDCELTKELAENWVETFFKVFGYYPGNWISSGHLAEKVLIQKGLPLPFFHDILYEIQELA
jgi:hypothetical protein